MKTFKYKASFASQVRCVIDSEKDKFLSEASLSSLKGLIPDGIKEQQDLLAVAFNACNVNLANKNGHLINNKTASEIYKSFIHKAINIEHNRSDGAIGHIVSAAFSKFDINFASGSGSEILEASDVKDKKDPFNISLSGVLYRLYADKLVDYIEDSNDPEGKHYLDVSASWELMFDSYVLAVGSRYLNECEIIDDPAKIEEMSKYLLSNGGTGKTPEGKIISMLIVGEVLPVGIGLTETPAAEVAGVISEASEVNTKTVIEDIVIDALKKSQNSNSQSKNVDVKANNNTKNIKKSMLKTLKDLNDEILKEATASEIIKASKIDLDAEINRVSSEWEEKKNKVENELKASKETQEKLQKEVTESKAELVKVQDELNKLIKAAQDKELEETFNARMTYFDTEFELDEKSRNAVANRIKGLDEAGYKQEKEDLETLLAAKKKGFVPFKKKGEKEDENSKEDKKEDKKEAKASEEVKGDVVADALDKGEKVAASVAATTTPPAETQAQKFAKAFGKDAWVVNPNVVRK
jgi:hypothetical protein